jgi:pimeloyl-ACP methyl ester carboxylesterase
MTLSEWVRVIIIIVLVVVLLLKQKGLLKSFRERKQREEKKAAKERNAQLKQEKRQRQIRKIEEKKKQTAEILRTSLGGGLEQKCVEVAGQDLHYFEGGRGSESVLLLHGFASTKEDWARFAKCLIHEGYRVVAVDLPGFGQNKRDPDLSYDVTTQAKRVRAFTEKLGLKSLHLVGSSIGGTIAAAYTYGFSQDVSTLTLMEPFCVRVSQATELDEFETQGRNPLGIATPEAYDNLLGFLFVQPPSLTDSVKRLRAEDAARYRDFYLKVWREVRSGDKAYILDMLLPEIDKKILVLQGGKSRFVHPMTAEMIRRIVKVPDKAHVVLMEDCGHLPAVEKPEAAAGHWLRFLKA